MHQGGVIIEKLEILEELLLNHKENVDLDDYILQKDIVEKSRYSTTTICRRFNELKENNYIKEHTSKTKLYNSMSKGNGKIFVPTLKGIEHGGLEGKFHKITGGSAEESVFDRYGIGLCDMHGKLQIKIPIKSQPHEEDDFAWKGPNDKMQNGVKQYIRYCYKAGDQVSIEKFVHEYNGPKSIILKPRFISNYDDSPEDLIERFIDIAWAIWTDLKMKGYELSFPQGPEGEAKFTLSCPAFNDIGYTESNNVIIDYSKGEPELHPATGSLHANKIMAELLLDSKTISNKFEKQIFSEEEMMKGFDEIGEYSKMLDIVKKLDERHKKTEKKVGVIAKSFNKLMTMVESEEQPEPDFDVPDEPQGGMYG